MSADEIVTTNEYQASACEVDLTKVPKWGARTTDPMVACLPPSESVFVEVDGEWITTNSEDRS